MQLTLHKAARHVVASLCHNIIKEGTSSWMKEQQAVCTFSRSYFGNHKIKDGIIFGRYPNAVRLSLSRFRYLHVWRMYHIRSRVSIKEQNVINEDNFQRECKRPPSAHKNCESNKITQKIQPKRYMRYYYAICSEERNIEAGACSWRIRRTN